MGLFEYNYDSDVLRAIGHARLQVSSGKGLESIIFALAQADVGLISEALQAPLEKMKVGWPTQDVLQEAIETTESKSYGQMLGALMAEGDAAMRRLEEISQEVQLERRLKIDAYGKRIAGTLNMVAILFLGTFVPVFLKILEQIPENDIIPQLILPRGFYLGYYALLALLLTVLMLGMRYSD
jgi:hypothetical protein